MRKPFLRAFSLILCFALPSVFSAGCAQDESEADAYVVRLGKSEDFSGTAKLTSQGAVFDSDARNPQIRTETLKVPLKKRGILELTVSNDSNLDTLNFAFVTEEDPVWSAFKKIKVAIPKNAENETVLLDLSGTYGWLGTLTGFSVEASGLENGRVLLKTVAFKEGGAGWPPLDIGDEEIYMDAKTRAAKNIFYAPDGIMGQLKTQDGIRFFLSNGNVIKTTGTPDDPIKQIHFTNSIVENVDRTEFRYASIAQVIPVPDSERLIGITHLERDLIKSKATYAATIALSVSDDGGDTWTMLDEIISHEMPLDAHPEQSRDIGNGTMLIRDGYLYIYCTDVSAEGKPGLSVSRVSLTDLFAAVSKDKVPELKKWFNGRWDEPGMGGKFTNVMGEGIAPNFHYIHYNEALGKYLMVMTQAPYYKSNDGDMALLISDDFLNWDVPMYYIACGRRGEQYPTLVGLGDDPQNTSGEEFYLYYCSWKGIGDNPEGDWQVLWGTANLVRRKIRVLKTDGEGQ